MSFDKTKIRLAVAGAVIIGAILTCIYCSQYEYGNEYLVDMNGNKVTEQGFKDIICNWECPDGAAQYMISNRWPKWSPFYNEKYGLIDLKTGTVSEPKFSDRLVYRRDGLAWDYEGHLVDGKGDIAVDCSSILKDGRFLDNPRKFALDALNKVMSMRYSLRGGFGYGLVEVPQIMQNYESVGLGENQYVGVYAPNGLASFFSSVKLRYGYMDMNGNIVIPARYGSVYEFDDNGLAVVYDPEYDENGDRGYGLINENGEEIIGSEYYELKILSDKYIATRKMGKKSYTYWDADGQPVVESEYIPEGYSEADDLFVVRETEGGECEVMDHEGNIVGPYIFENDKTSSSEDEDNPYSHDNYTVVTEDEEG